jgi:protein SCO1/2
MVLALACSGASREAPSAGAGYRGVAAARPIPKPSFTLTDFNGQPFDFERETRDRVALLFFGYTHCPDVCPVHMANIAAVLRSMPWEERSHVRTVFVTTDPARDTPARLKEWLGGFDRTFIGLTGEPARVTPILRALGAGEPRREATATGGADYTVSHSAQVYAFARDGYAYLQYPFGIRQEDWANDLPKLARDSTGADVRAALARRKAAGAR